MRTRRLGSTGYKVSEIGFGAWGLGGNMWLGVSDEAGREALHQALALGVTFIDTALAYGEGHSERLIAETVAGLSGREEIVIATKIPPRDRVWPGKGATPLAKSFSARHIVECVERSLHNLRTEALQLEQFHVWHDDWLASPEWAQMRQAMLRLKREGKVLHWGVSVNDHAPDTAMRLLNDPLIETAQVIYNIYDRSPEQDLFELARRKDLGLIARVPLDEGALTGAIGPNTVFPAGDWREGYFRGARRAEAARRAGALEKLLGEEAATLPELALRFSLTPPEISTVIPGMRHPEHARANAAISDGRTLSPAMIARLKEHAWEKNWYGS